MRPYVRTSVRTYVRPELDLRIERTDFFQTWYNHGPYHGAYARYLNFDLGSKMAAWRPYLFSKRALFVVCPELDLRSLPIDFFQTWYNHGPYHGAYARYLIFDLGSKMAAWRPYLILKRALFVCPELDLRSLPIDFF